MTPVRLRRIAIFWAVIAVFWILALHIADHGLELLFQESQEDGSELNDPFGVGFLFFQTPDGLRLHPGSQGGFQNGRNNGLRDLLDDTEFGYSLSRIPEALSRLPLRHQDPTEDADASVTGLFDDGSEGFDDDPENTSGSGGKGGSGGGLELAPEYWKRKSLSTAVSRYLLGWANQVRRERLEAEIPKDNGEREEEEEGRSGPKQTSPASASSSSIPAEQSSDAATDASRSASSNRPGQEDRLDPIISNLINRRTRSQLRLDPQARVVRLFTFTHTVQPPSEQRTTEDEQTDSREEASETLWDREVRVVRLERPMEDLLLPASRFVSLSWD